METKNKPITDTLAPYFDIEDVRNLFDAVGKLHLRVNEIGDPKERGPVEEQSDMIHKLYKKMFINSKLLHTLHQENKSINQQ